MMQINRRTFITSLMAFAVLPAHKALADRERRRRGKRRRHDDDHDVDYEHAGRARRSGDVVPLRDILAEVGKRYKGEVVGIEFEKDDGVWIYEIKMVTQDGRYLELYVDAKSKKILKVEGE